MSDFTSVDASLIRLVAKWVEDGKTPSLMPKTLSRHLGAIAKSIEREIDAKTRKPNHPHSPHQPLPHRSTYESR